MTEDYGTGTKVLVVANGIDYGIGAVVFPVKTVPIPYRWK